MNKNTIITLTIIIVVFTCNVLFASGGVMSTGGIFKEISFSDISNIRNIVITIIGIIIAVLIIYTSNKIKIKIGCFNMNCLEILLVIAIIGILAAMQPPNIRTNRKPNRQKACYSNIRVIMGGVEMFNMDNNIKMDEVDETRLIKGGYLKSNIRCPERSDNKYIAFGPLFEYGEVGCAAELGKTDDPIGFNLKGDRFYIDYHGTITGEMLPSSKSENSFPFSKTLKIFKTKK